MKGLLITCGGLVGVIVVTTVLYLTGHPTGAWAVSTFGTLGWLFGVLGFVVIFDPQKRWPRASVFQRLTNVLTFTK